VTLLGVSVDIGQGYVDRVSMQPADLAAMLDRVAR
jgi:hypothetical protein